jgi:hypothetical protein
MAKKKIRSLILYYLSGLVAMFAGMAALLYAVGAAGLFGDRWPTRIVDIAVCLVLIVVTKGMISLATWLGERWTSGR